MILKVKWLIYLCLSILILRQLILKINFKNQIKVLELSDDYSRSTASYMFWYEDNTKSVDFFKSENEFETPAAADGRTIAIK